jgi:hypothetical protein
MHEFSHIFVAILLLGKIKKIKIKRLDHVRLYIENLNTSLKVKLVSFSPIIVPIIFILLTLFKDTNFIFAVFYLISTVKTTLPSLLDFTTAKVKVPNFLKKLYL